MICSTVMVRGMVGRRVDLLGQVEIGAPNDVSVYLAGPIDSSGRADLNLPTFYAAARALRERGFMVFNPAERVGNSPESGSRESGVGFDRALIQRRNFKGLAGCDLLVLLPGWEKSPGVEAELLAAREFGIPAVQIHELLSADERQAWAPAEPTKKEEARGLIHAPLLVGAVAFTAAILLFVFLIVQFSVR